MVHRVVAVPAVIALVAVSPPILSAQTTEANLTTLMRTQILDVWTSKTAAGTPVLVDPPDPAALPTLNPFNIVTQIEQQIASQLSSLPLGSSSGGFTYRYDSTLGTFVRSTGTFGPAFAERAQTLGRGRFNVGLSYQSSRYSHLDGRALDSGAIRFILPPGTITDPSVGNLIEAEMRLRLISNTAVVFATAGVTDRLDVGVAVPYQQIVMNVTTRATIHDFSPTTLSPASLVFPNGTRTDEWTARGSARGVGDVVVRGKYRLTRSASPAYAVSVDVRLPTGDADNMLGHGSAQGQVLLVSSYPSRTVAPHFNVGYTKSGEGVPDQVNFVAGLEVAVSPQVTLIGDVIGRLFRDSLRLNDGVVRIVQPGNPALGIPALTSAQFATVEPGTDNLTSFLGAVGLKVNPARNILVSAHVIMTATDGGLRRRVTPVVGFDYSF
jgi:hypothetical protein